MTFIAGNIRCEKKTAQKNLYVPITVVVVRDLNHCRFFEKHSASSARDFMSVYVCKCVCVCVSAERKKM